jgi:hypothetical protein
VQQAHETPSKPKVPALLVHQPFSALFQFKHISFDAQSAPQSRKRSQDNGSGNSKNGAKAEAQETLPQGAAVVASVVSSGSLSDCEVDTNILSMNRSDIVYTARFMFSLFSALCHIFPRKLAGWADAVLRSTPAHSFAFGGGFPNSGKTPSAFKRKRRM